MNQESQAKHNVRNFLKLECHDLKLPFQNNLKIKQALKHAPQTNPYLHYGRGICGNGLTPQNKTSSVRCLLFRESWLGVTPWKTVNRMYRYDRSWQVHAFCPSIQWPHTLWLLWASHRPWSLTWGSRTWTKGAEPLRSQSFSGPKGKRSKRTTNHRVDSCECYEEILA